METVLNRKSVKTEKHDAFQRFCSSLRNPVFTENNHILISVNVVCYKGNLLLPFWGEILLFTHGNAYGTLRFSDGDLELFDDGVYNLLECAECEYLAGRNHRVLVIEAPLLQSKGVHRLDLTEDVKRLASL